MDDPTADTQGETVADKFRPLQGDRPTERFTVPVAAPDLWDLVDEVFRLRAQIKKMATRDS